MRSRYTPLVAVFLTACSHRLPMPAGAPPSPETVTREEPGGDAASPEVAALMRLAEEPFATSADRDGKTFVPLADAQQWRRVRFFLFDPFTGFRYGDAHHAVAGVYVIDAPKEKATSAECLRAFERWASPLVRGMEIEVTDPEPRTISWRGAPMTVRMRDATVLWGTEKKTWAGVYGAYVAWPRTCAVLAYAFSGGDDVALARRVRDRFAEKAYPLFFTRAAERPKP